MTHAKYFRPLMILLATTLAMPISALAQEGTDEAEVSAEGQRTEQTEEEADDKKLADRIKSVQRKAFIKRGRFEVTPYFGLDLNDPFYQHMILGASGAFHLADSMSLELRFGRSLARIKQDAIQFVREETDSLIVDPPEFQMHLDADFLWAPFYGKISLFGEAILHFDTFVTAGPGIFWTDGGANPAMNIGIGQRYFINDWIAARVELRDYIFIDVRNGESDLQNLLVFGMSVSLFFPMTFDYEYQ